jgi:IS1 family transposase
VNTPLRPPRLFGHNGCLFISKPWRLAFFRFQNCPIVFVASSGHSRSASNTKSSTALKNFTALTFGLPKGRSLPAVTRTATTPQEKLRGDFYMFPGIDRRTKLFVSHLPGKRNYKNTNDFVADLASRVSGLVQMTCDGSTAYVPTIRAHLLGRLNLAVMQKTYSKNTSESILLCVDTNYRYSQPKCTGIKLTITAGPPDIDKICTSPIERLNLSVRTFNRRFTRLCLDFSRKLANRCHSVALLTMAYSFCKVHSTPGWVEWYNSKIEKPSNSW